jgi:transposase-like protein
MIDTIKKLFSWKLENQFCPNCDSNNFLIRDTISNPELETYYCCDCDHEFHKLLDSYENDPEIEL